MTFLGGLLGLCLGVGLLMMYAGLRGGGQPARPPRQPWSHEAILARLLAAVSLALLGGLVTGWPDLVLGGAVAGWFLPSLLAQGRAARQRDERAAALVDFVDLVADLQEGSGQGLEAILKTAAAVAPRPIRAQTAVLAEQLGGRLSMSEALVQFAEVMADPIADQLVMAFRRGDSAQLTRVLRAIAASGRSEIELRRRAEAGRSGLRWTGRAIVGLAVAVAVGMTLLNRRYLAPYDGVVGQLVLAVVIGVFALSFWLMDYCARSAPPPRLLRGQEPLR